MEAPNFPARGDAAVPPGTSPVAARPADIRALLDRIGDQLYRRDGDNQNTLLTFAIVELIAAGVDSRQRIVGAATALGFDRKHAGALLGRGREWCRGEDGIYRLVAA